MTETASVTDDQYEPGVCNIGRDEIRRRRLSGHVGALAAVGLLAALLATGAPRVVRLLVALPAAVGASGYLQARERFCAAYGRLGVFNFGLAGAPSAVIDESARDADRRTARRIAARGVLIGLAAGVAALLLPD